jgi:FemAB-related protein (PEP-CTERM system-associated)
MTTTIAVPAPSRVRAVRHATARPPLVVRPVQTADDEAGWAQYVAGARGATLFHHPDWCRSVERVFGHQPRHLLAARGTEVVGVLPLVEVNSLIGGRMLISVPYGTYGGVLADEHEAARALAQQAIGLTDWRGARVLDLRSAQAGLPELEDVPGYVGFTRRLPERPEEVPAFLPKRARAAARHARDRDGVVVRHDSESARTVWQLYSRSMRRLGSINYPYSLFAELMSRLGKGAWVTVAWLGERPVAGTLSFVFGDTIMPYVLGADERIRCEGAANLLYWSVMERAVQEGIRNFDYGRSRADNAGAVGFKKNQGFEPRPLGYQRYVPVDRQAPDLKPSNPRFARARHIWRRLPLCVTRPLGAWAARSLPG